jgi:two-component system chemotaxis sensor kinase CheA
MDELMAQFCIEARELVQQSTEDLLALEREPGDRRRLESAFRSIHTLKGSVGLFDFQALHQVLHLAEDLLAGARDGSIDVDLGLIDPLLAVIDWIDGIIDPIAQTGQLSEKQVIAAGTLLDALQKVAAAPITAEPLFAAEAMPQWASDLQARMRDPAPCADGLVAIAYTPHPECFFNGDDPFATMAQVPGLRHLEFALKEPVASRADFDPYRCNLVLQAIAEGPLARIQAVFRLLPDQVRLVELAVQAPIAAVTDPAEGPQAASTDRNAVLMRVEAARIDSLVEIAGELVAAKNGLLPLAGLARDGGDDALARQILASQSEIERLVNALYGAVTQARMVPVDQTFRRFARLVRETAARLGKAIDLVVEGEATEADRNIVEALFEPLLHLVRNAMDHGVETAAERLACSKPPRARLLLRARQRGDRMEVEVSDDGRGMDPIRVRDAAVAKGLLTSDQAEAMTDVESLQLVFSPGFSTAKVVSDLSGRGVGLDAVKTAVQKLGGALELTSRLGVGTTFVLRLPVSFSMSQLMVVEVGVERYGVPLEDIVETHRLAAADIRPIRAGQAFVLRQQTVPLLFLSDLLRLEPPGMDVADLKVLIVRAGGGRVGIAVDAIADRAETLTRPLGGLLQGMHGILGTTLLGDGKVLLVLNMEELVG